MSGLRNILSSIAMVAVLGVGFGMWLVVVPTEDKRRNLTKNLPESKLMTIEETRKRSAMVMQALKDAAETNENIVRGFGGTAK